MLTWGRGLLQQVGQETVNDRGWPELLNKAEEMCSENDLSLIL